jgi:hypothetical protein
VVGPEGTIEMQTGSDDREVPLDAAQSQLPRSVYFARTGTQPGVVATQLFSQVIACYPDGSIVLSRPDVPTALYLTKGRGGATYGGDVVLSLGDPEYAPGASAESERACFMDIKPTMGRVQFEIDTWERDYHTG